MSIKLDSGMRREKNPRYQICPSLINEGLKIVDDDEDFEVEPSSLLCLASEG